MASTQKREYHFSCHCQDSLFTLTLPGDALSPRKDEVEGGASTTDDPAPGLEEISVCDCSFCVKRLMVWTRQPIERVTFRRGCKEGAGAVKVYRFGKGELPHHWWCGKCGTHLMTIPTSEPGFIYLNLRALREPFVSAYDIPSGRIEQLKRGADEPKYEPATLSAEAQEITKQNQERVKREGHGEKVIHVGSCHCQAVVFSYLGRAVREAKTTACLCSICYGNGNIWTGDPDDRILFFPPYPDHPYGRGPYRPHPGRVTRYTFSDAPHSVNEHVFCKTCGCQVMEIKENNQTSRRELGVNVACFNGAFGADGQEAYAADGLGKGLKGFKVNAAPRGWEPQYKLRL